MKAVNELDHARFEALTFDCYGTLVDWESGLVSALRPLFRAHGVPWAGDDPVLELFARLEAAAEAGAYRSYRDVLGEVLDGMGAEVGFSAGPEDRTAFADSVGGWPVFQDTTAALRRLARRYRLAIVSNVDDALFARTAEALGVTFDEVVTAEQVGSYKPAPAHFHEVLRRLDLPRERVLHVAQSLFHDVAPAQALGLSCVWVNRRSGGIGSGATPPASARPDLEVADLRALADRLAVAD
jgi:2-haloacid dehalogenase